MASKKIRVSVDNDAPEMTTADFASAKPALEALPEIFAAAKRGRPPVAEPREVVSMRMSKRGAEAWKKASSETRGRLTHALEAGVVILGKKTKDRVTYVAWNIVTGQMQPIAGQSVKAGAVTLKLPRSKVRSSIGLKERRSKPKPAKYVG